MKTYLKELLSKPELGHVPYANLCNYKRAYCDDCGLEFDEPNKIYRCPECYSHSVRDITKAK